MSALLPAAPSTASVPPSWTQSADEIYVRMPSPEEVMRLQLGPGTPVACHINTGLTEDGTPVRVVVNVLPGDRHVIVYERDKTSVRG